MIKNRTNIAKIRDIEKNKNYKKVQSSIYPFIEKLSSILRISYNLVKLKKIVSTIHTKVQHIKVKCKYSPKNAK